MPPSRSAALRPPRAAIARNGRLRKGRGGAAAARARCRRAVEAVEHDGSPNEDVRSAPQKKPTSEELLIGEDGNWKVSENDGSEDDGKPASRRNKRRLQKKLTAGDTSCAEEREVVAPGEALQSDSKYDGKLASSRRLKCHQMVKGISNGWEESKAEVSEEISQSSSDGDGGKSEADAFENSQTSQSSSEDEDRNLLPKRRSKRLREKPKAEYFNIEVSDNENTRLSTSNDDELCFGTCRRLKRLRYTLRDRKVANGGDAFKSVADTTSLAHRRRSKRLLDKLKDKDVPNESNSEVSHSSMLSAFSTSDDEFFGNTLKAGISTLSGVVCSICKNGLASNLFVQCRNSYCSLRFHNFCLDLPMQGSEGTLACPLCKVNQVSLAKSTKEVLPYVKKIQKIVGHRRVILPNSDFQCQFLVKWESLSHHHDCWVPLEWLYVFDRLRVQIYRKKHLLLKVVYSEDQRQPEWFEVDRAIACRMKSHPNDSCDILTALEDDKNFEEYEFLVKWKGLDYCEATWEPCCTEGVLPSVSMLVKRHQDAYKRVQCASETCLDGMEIVSEEINNGALYDYQLQGLQWIFTNFKAKRNVILADEMGLGKTVQVVCFLHHIVKGNFTTSPALVIAPKSILLQWEKEFFRWGRDLNVIVYQGVRESRKCIQVHEMFSSEGKALFDALVTSYEFVQLDKAVLRKFKWSTIVIDEAQRMKKLDCNLATCLKQYSSEFRLLLTGTPLQNNLLELFALLHYIDPDEFSDPKAEAELFSSIESGRKSLTLDEKITRIHEILKPRMLRRMKSDVLTDSIPIKKWVEVPCALTDSQRELYINIVEKNYLKLNNAIQSGRKIALNFILMELKKCCNHLYLFPGLEVQQQAEEAVFLSLVAASGKLQLLHKLLPRLKERGNRVLIFSQMTKMLDILEDFLSFMGYKYARIDGQTSLSARQESIKEYNNVESGTFIFLMSTRAGGLGVDLPGADRVIIYDPDFNPFMDLQAQSRAHRIGQTRPVVVYQLITKCSVEEKILQKSKQKLAIENILMNSSKKPSADELQSILLHGAKTIVDRNKVNAASIHYDEEAIENLLKLDPSPGEKCSSDDNGYLGSIVSFAHGVETEEEPLSPKAEVLKALQPVPKVVDLGRGKRQKKAVNYADENSDSDDMYAPERSSTARSSSSDDETESMVPEVVSVTDS